MTTQIEKLRAALILLVASAVLLSASVCCFAQDFKPYPGSKLDEAASHEATAGAVGKAADVYTTSDAFDKVYAFYKALYKESTTLGTGRKLPSGLQVRWAFFILDGAAGLPSSTHWIKVQNPYLTGPGGKDVRDLTVIDAVRAK